ncbi:MAG: RebB family R body protein [Crocosphaera sp.]
MAEDKQTPPKVNSQITDAVSQTHVAVIGEAPAQSMAMVYQSMAHSTSLLMQNSVMAQGGMQQINSAVVASACQRLMALPTQKTTSSLPVDLIKQLNGQKKDDEDENISANIPPTGGSAPNKLTDTETKAVILKAAQQAAKVAEIASQASADYNETQEIAEDVFKKLKPSGNPSSEGDQSESQTILNNAKAASTAAHNAARYSKLASQASQRADALYAQIFDAVHRDPPDRNTIKSLYRQLQSLVSKAEAAASKVREYQSNVKSLNDLDL